MTKFPVWKYILIIVGIVVGLVYTIPNFYGEVPAVQISSNNNVATVDTNTLSLIEKTLAQNDLSPTGEIFNDHTLKFKFPDTDTQIKARDVIQNVLGNNYIIALNLVSNSPEWFSHINALPMFLGLDLRGGVHFLLSVDMQAAVKKRLNQYSGDIRRDLRNNDIRYGSVNIDNDTLNVQLRDVSSMPMFLTPLQSVCPTTFGT